MRRALQNKSQDYRRLSDEDLVFRYVERYEADTIAEIHRRYAHLIMGVCLKYLKDHVDAEEAVQQIFIKMLDDLPRFQIKNFKAWFYQVARNHCLMHLRQNKKMSYSENLEIVDVETEDLLHLKQQEEELLKKMEDALLQLNEEQQACIRLFYYEKKNYAEIAALRGLDIMKVKSAIQNGKRNLKIMLANQNGM